VHQQGIELVERDALFDPGCQGMQLVIGGETPIREPAE
jgi:hypothetical protein